MDPIVRMTEGISVNTQSSIRVTDGKTIVYFDPLEIPGEPHDADCVFVTHSHGDHFSPSDIARLLKAETVLVVPEDMAEKAAEAADGRQVVAVLPEGKYEAAGVVFETVPAYNPAKRFHPRANGWVGYVVSLGGARIYVTGDTDATEEAAAVDCDIVLLPVGGKYTMTAEEAAELVNRMKPAVAIPTHYGTIVGGGRDGCRFAELLNGGIRTEFPLG